MSGHWRRAVSYALQGSALGVLLTLFLHALRRSAACSRCEISLVAPVFEREPVPQSNANYSLWRYNDAILPEPECSAYSKIVLFVPGNAGVHAQARSLGSALAAAAFENKLAGLDAGPCTGVFAVDFGRELCAFSAGLLAEQAKFVGKAVNHVHTMKPTRLHTNVNDNAAQRQDKQASAVSDTAMHNQKRKNASTIRQYESLRDPRPKLVIVGHSMGGVVARLLKHAYPDAIITLSTPHVRHPFAMTPGIAAIYRYLSASSPLVSIASGPADLQVPTKLSSVGYTLSTEKLAHSWADAHHLATAWERGMLHVLAHTLLSPVWPFDAPLIQNNLKFYKYKSSFQRSTAPTLCINVPCRGLDLSAKSVCALRPKAKTVTLKFVHPVEVVTTESPDAVHFSGKTRLAPGRSYVVTTVTGSLTNVTETVTHTRQVRRVTWNCSTPDRPRLFHRDQLAWELGMDNWNAVGASLAARTFTAVRPSATFSAPAVNWWSLAYQSVKILPDKPYSSLRARINAPVRTMYIAVRISGTGPAPLFVSVKSHQNQTFPHIQEVTGGWYCIATLAGDSTVALVNRSHSVDGVAISVAWQDTFAQNLITLFPQMYFWLWTALAAESLWHAAAVAGVCAVGSAPTPLDVFIMAAMWLIVALFASGFTKQKRKALVMGVALLPFDSAMSVTLGLIFAGSAAWTDPVLVASAAPYVASVCGIAVSAWFALGAGGVIGAVSTLATALLPSSVQSAALNLAWNALLWGAHGARVCRYLAERPRLRRAAAVAAVLALRSDVHPFSAMLIAPLM